MDTLTAKPRIAPRSAADVLLCVPIGILQAILVFFVPACMAWYLSGSVDAGMVVYVALGLTWLAWSVTRLELTAQGIRFVRWLGSPKFLPWGDIRSIQVTPAKELIMRGWLWPLFPAREMTFSLTVEGHYRITYAGGDTYFPPADEAAFRDFVSRHMPNAA